MSKDKIWLSIGIMFILSVMFAVLAVDAQGATLAYNTSDSVAGTSGNVNTYGGTAGRMIQNFTATGDYLTKVGINISNYTGSLTPAGTYVNIRVLYDSQVVAAMSNATNISNLTFPLPLLDTQNALTGGTYVEFDFAANKVPLNISQSYTVLFTFLGGGTGKNINGKNTAVSAYNGISSSYAGIAATDKELLSAIYFENASAPVTVTPFTTTAKDYYDNQVLSQFSTSVNGTNYNQTFYTTNSSVVVYPLADMSGNNNSYVARNEATNTPYGKIGNGYIFDGSNDYINGSNLYITTNQSTVCAWVNPKSSQSNYVLSQYGSTASIRGFTLYQSNSVYQMYFSNGNSISTGAVAIPNYWTHICGAINGTNKLIYVNGSLYNSQNTGAGAYNSTKPLNIARDGDSGGYWNGSIDELYVYNRNLTATEIYNIYSQNSASQDGLMLYLPFENITSTSSDPVSALSDKSLNGNTLTNNNAILNGSGSNTYYSFDGTNVKYLQNSTTFGSIGNSFTICTDFEPFSLTTGMIILDGISSSSAVQKYGLYHTSALTFRTSNGSSATSSSSSAGAIIANTRYFACGTVNGSSGNQTLYINNILADTDINTGNYTQNNTVIGINGNLVDNKFNGNIYRIIFYNRVISSSEITNLYQNGTPNPNGLVAYYDFNTAGTLYNLTTASTQNGGYFPRAYEGYNVSTQLNAPLWQSEVNFQGREKFTLNFRTVTATVTNQTNTSTLYLKAGAYTGTFNNSNYYNVTQAFTATALVSETVSVSGLYNAIFNLTAANNRTSLPVSLFYANVTRTDDPAITESLSTSSGNISFGILNGTYEVEFYAPGYVYTTFNVSVGTLVTTNYTVNLTAANAIEMFIYSQANMSLINVTTVNIFTEGTSTSYANSTTNGTFYIYNLTSDTYQISFQAAGFDNATYIVTVGNGTAQSLDVYMVPETSDSVIFAFKDQDNDLTVLEGVLFTQQLKVNGTYYTVQVKYSDVTGRVELPYLDGATYRFTASLDGYVTKEFTLSPIIFTSYNVRLTKGSGFNDSQLLSGINIEPLPTQYLDNATNNFSVQFSSPNGDFEYYQYILVSSTNYSNVLTGIGTNAYGETLVNTLNISGANFSDKVYLSLSYYLTTGASGTLNLTYDIGLNQSNTFFDNDSENIPLLDRVILVTMLLLIVVSLASVYGGTTGALVVGIFTVTILTAVGIIAWYLTAGVVTLYILLLGLRVTSQQ